MKIQKIQYAIFGLFLRNIKILTRQKQLLIAPIILPIVVMFFTALVMGAGGDQWQIGLVNKSNSEESKNLVKAIKSSHSNITNYFNIREKNLTKAEKLVRNGRLQMLVIIPEDFDNSKTLYTETFNVNTDMMKNVRLRLEHSVNDYLNNKNELSIIPILRTEKENDVWRVTFIAGSCFLLSLFFGITITSANLFAFDRENRTRKELLLTPINLLVNGFAIIISSLFMTIITSLPTLLLAILIFKFKLYYYNMVIVYTGMLPILVACSCIGIIIAHYLKNYRVFQPVIIISSMATFFGSGGFTSVAALPDNAQIFSKIWLFSYIFEIFNPILHNFSLSISISIYEFLIFLTIAMLGVLSIHFIYKREELLNIGSGQ